MNTSRHIIYPGHPTLIICDSFIIITNYDSKFLWQSRINPPTSKTVQSLPGTDMALHTAVPLSRHTDECMKLLLVGYGAGLWVEL